MLSALVTFAAEEGGSHTLFYVIGGLAALYGVGIAVVGITQPSFPKTHGTARAVFALSALIVAAAMASAVIAS